MPDIDDDGLLQASETSLLTDLYELAMASSYHRRDMDDPAVFELFVRRLPAHRDWLVSCGLGSTLRMVESLAFGERELEYLASLGYGEGFLERLSGFRFGGDIDAMPEGTVAFAGEPLVRVTASRIEAQLIETLLLNQICFQTAIATKAARIVLAAGGGQPDRTGSVIDFSPRRDHGADAAMKAARSAAIVGAGGTSNVAAAMRFGLTPVGTMAHSYVMSYESEVEAFASFMEDMPDPTTLLVDTFDSLEGVRQAIEASERTGIPIGAVRIDSGDLLELSRRSRELLDEAGHDEARVFASGDLEERYILELVGAGAPIDGWGVGTELGTSRDSPVVSGVYKLVADQPQGWEGWRPVAKRSPDKATVGHPKQVFRASSGGRFTGDVIGAAGEDLPGSELLVPVMRGGGRIHTETLGEMRSRARSQLEGLPPGLGLAGEDQQPGPEYPVELSERLKEIDAEGDPVSR